MAMTQTKPAPAMAAKLVIPLICPRRRPCPPSLAKRRPITLSTVMNRWLPALHSSIQTSIRP